jgi:hypothetical protein
MKPPKCRLCEHAHWSNEPHVFASNTASNRSASNNGRENLVKSGSKERVEPLQGSGKAVAKVERGRSGSVQRGLQRDGVEPADVPASASGADAEVAVEDNGVERCVDGGERLKQRWSRDAYNKYQRDLMRKRREKKKAGFIGIAYG